MTSPTSPRRSSASTCAPTRQRASAPRRRHRDPLLQHHLQPGRRREEGDGRPAPADAARDHAGQREILEIFEVSKVGNIAGCRVTDGKVERGANVRLIRDNVVIHEGKLSQLKRFKDDAREVVAGQECGMAFENYQDMKVGDVIECYRVETVQRSL